MQDDTKVAAAKRSMDFIESGMKLGIGSGTTLRYVVEQLGERVQQGLDIVGVPTSRATGELAARHGIPLTTFEKVQTLDLAIDGADEIGPGLALIKGGGGQLLHEKIVASAAKRFLVVVGEGKVVPQLGRFPLPVEVIQFAAPLVVKALEELGGKPQLRAAADGSPYLTDEQNWIYDCRFGTIDDPQVLAAAIRSIVGVVEHGLFLDMATEAVVADADGIRVIGR